MLSEASAQAPYFPLQPSGFKVVNASWGNVGAEIDAAPGDVNIPLTVTVQNIGNSTVTGVSMKLVLQQPFTNMSGGRIANAFYEESISPGLTGTSRFVLSIDPNAIPGEYILRMVIDYLMVVTGVGKTLYIAMETEVQVPVLVTKTRYVVIYSVGVFPGEVTPAGNFTVSGTVVNAASASLYNTNVSVSSPAVVRGASIFIGQIDPNIPRPFSFPLQIRRELPNGSFPIKILVTYQDLSLGVTHVNSAATVIRVQQREVPTRPTEPPKRSLAEMIVDILSRILRFFFGFSALVTAEYGRGGI